MFVASIALVAACLTLTTAQPSFTSTGSDIRVVRQRTETNIADTLARIESTLIPAVHADAIISAQGAAFNATVQAMAATNTQVQAMVSTINALQSDLNSRLGAAESRMATDGAILRAEVSSSGSSMREDLEDMVSSQISTVTSQNTALRTSLTASLASVSAGVAVQISRTTATLTSSSVALRVGLTSTVTAQLATKADAETYMWTGGCTNAQHGGNWREYCLNQAHVNKPGSNPTKFTVSGTRFRATAHAYFTLTFWSIFRTCSWQRSQMHMDSSSKHYGINRGHPWEGGHSWRDFHMTVTHPTRAGREMYMVTYSDCWDHYHTVNGNGHHSRITLLYLSPF